MRLFVAVDKEQSAVTKSDRIAQLIYDYGCDRRDKIDDRCIKNASKERDERKNGYRQSSIRPIGIGMSRTRRCGVHRSGHRMIVTHRQHRRIRRLTGSILPLRVVRHPLLASLLKCDYNIKIVYTISPLFSIVNYTKKLVKYIAFFVAIHDIYLHSAQRSLHRREKC